MAKRRYSFDENKIARFHKQKRGQGQGADYHPWLTIHDVPSSGRRSRPHCPKTGREHHLLSDLETAVFFLMNWEDRVVDIREQFPLDRDRTRAIAVQMGVNHPKDRESGVDLVMTLDFLVDVLIGGSRISMPLCVKPWAKLEDRRTLEKLEIERRYCIETWTTWRIVTEREYSKPHVANLRWMHEMHSLDLLSAPHPGHWSDRCDQLLNALRSYPGKTVGAVFDGLEDKHAFGPGEALTALRHLLARKSVFMDLNSPFRLEMPVSALRVPDARTSAREAA